MMCQAQTTRLTLKKCTEIYLEQTKNVANVETNSKTTNTKTTIAKPEPLAEYASLKTQRSYQKDTAKLKENINTHPSRATNKNIIIQK